ncbi:triose-phosphate isomerase [Pullulanibacillus sp. KACC 23026]|uniref:triose-phosphate isomerase family protein n=1 Tax=Pullulanibacillus sp. KACC 23026 TaxID=3028315 RepID=UPI0023B2054B|nr:triose-phosphate isomerase family protein [Pullulanibacillus sp. KACC 23026]WEG13321.1 triose-phosphate isomerase [Pullulanibacillus sp. KACC 23026]
MADVYIGTNWKMNMDPDLTTEWAKHLRMYMLHAESKPTVFVMPPFPLIPQLMEELKGTDVLIGAQNCHWETTGSYTGEISPRLLAKMGVDMVLVGHAERRAQFNETNQMIHKKLSAVLKEGMRAVLCIGEDHTVKGKADETERVLREQLEIALQGIELTSPDQVILAYEPVWAIGEHGEDPAPGEIRSSLEIIRQVSYEILREYPPIVYGGSVNPDNAQELLAVPFVNGLFVGRHALDGEQFTHIAQITVSERVENA